VTPARLLDAKEVAELLSVPATWVREQTRTGDLPHLRLGRYVRFDQEAVLAWLETQRAGQWRKHSPKVTDRDDIRDLAHVGGRS
jgi:excisionase family DNA binding protein